MQEITFCLGKATLSLVFSLSFDLKLSRLSCPPGSFFFPLSSHPPPIYLFSPSQAATTSNDPRSASPDVAQRTAGLMKRRGSNEQEQQGQAPQLERNSGGSPRTVFGEFFSFFSARRRRRG